MAKNKDFGITWTTTYDNDVRFDEYQARNMESALKRFRTFHQPNCVVLKIEKLKKVV